MQTRIQTDKRPIVTLLCCRMLVASFWVISLTVFGQRLATAAITTWTSEASFTSQLQAGYYIENFTSVSGGGATISLSGGSGPFAYTISTSPPGVGLNAISTDFSGKAVSPAAGPVSVIITFTSGNVTAVGGNFFPVDSSGALVQAGTVHALLNNGSFLDLATTDNTHVGFGGFTSDGAAITSLTLSGVTFPAVDNLYVGQLAAVPEAGGWVAAGFVGFFVVGRSGYIFLRRNQGTRPQ